MNPINHRDLGGLAVAGGNTTRRLRLLRSAAPAPGDAPPGVPYTLVIDLRCPSEYGAKRHPYSATTDIASIPLLTEAELSSAQQHSGRIDAAAWYRDVLQTHGERLAAAAQRCIDSEGPILVHCAAGRDRTGLLVGLLLGLADVPHDVVEADYLQSNRHVGQQPAGQGPIISGAHADSIRSAISVWEDAGGPAAWAIARGLTPAEIERWRESFILQQEVESDDRHNSRANI
ncbi:tyrosine-protein phosphatase [Rhodococcus rhodochrous]|uniref:tyrosine-protein phosphatase n=1 Tax=Rhodococcus rhodochrous TaxID=1829 RepID=UPI001E340BBD|nr:tyrosine-protein phosphatase [Rhodococcus rhodochrous]MCB8913423.1 tyrosine-protein phosphatase [Rhodococcus rhodochrous]